MYSVFCLSGVPEMRHTLQRLFFAFLSAVLLFLVLPSNRAQAQTYQIDCAILLCLSGGWPASAPCVRARAEFIRRITPWPVEPPLQIWRCPMAASYRPGSAITQEARLYDAFALSSERPLPQSTAPIPTAPSLSATLTVTRLNAPPPFALTAELDLQLVQNRADIDISGPEFNFVRSIRVFDVRYARQYESGSEGDCNRSAVVSLGTYGTQGEFSWNRSSIGALPPAHLGLERYGEHCPGIWHRSVFVEWRDYLGNYGYEQVNY